MPDEFEMLDPTADLVATLDHEHDTLIKELDEINAELQGESIPQDGFDKIARMIDVVGALLKNAHKERHVMRDDLEKIFNKNWDYFAAEFKSVHNQLRRVNDRLDNTATKQDVAATKQDIATLREEMSDFRKEVRDDIRSNMTEIREKMEALLPRP